MLIDSREVKELQKVFDDNSTTINDSQKGIDGKKKANRIN